MPKNVEPSPLFLRGSSGSGSRFAQLATHPPTDISRQEQVTSHVEWIQTGRVPNHIDKLLEIMQGRGGRTDRFTASTW